jgi:hypothetical protein
MEAAMEQKGKSSFARTMKAVMWSFFGVRRSRDHAADATQLNLLHVIAAAVIAAAVFIGVLIAIVHMVVSKG